MVKVTLGRLGKCPETQIHDNHIIFVKNSKIEIIAKIENMVSNKHLKVDGTLF